jgi:hypothetical protein
VRKIQLKYFGRLFAAETLRRMKAIDLLLYSKFTVFSRSYLVKYRIEKETITLPGSGRIFPGSAILACTIRKSWNTWMTWGAVFTAK